MTDCSAYLAEYRERISARIKELEHLEMPSAGRRQYEEFFQNGNRVNYERIYFARREFLTVYGLAVVLREDFAREEWGNGDGLAMEAYAGRLLAIIRDILREPTWVLPAHGSMEHFDGRLRTIDLFAAETAGSIGEILYLIREFPFGENDRKIYRETVDCYVELTEHRIMEVFEARNPCDWWEGARMNWAAVCAGNVWLAPYYMGKLRAEAMPEKRLTAIAERVEAALGVYLDEIERMEVCQEGVGYYQYGMMYFLAAYELLAESYGFTLSFPNAAEFLPKMYLGDGKYVSFSDCTPQNRIHMGMMAYLSSCYPQVCLSRDYVGERLALADGLMEVSGGQECHRWAGAYRDYIWVKRYGSSLRTGMPQKAGFHFPLAQWHIQHIQEDACVVIKGGNNGGSHNHNDVGSFSYWLEGEEYLCDLGSGEYSRDYFSESRYRILCCGSEGHNVPLVDGQLQEAGEEYGCTDWQEKQDGLEMSFGAAYGMEGGDVTREFRWGKIGIVEIRDTVRGKEVTENLVTRIKPQCHGEWVILQGKKGLIALEIRIVDSEDGKVRQALVCVEERKHKNHEGDTETVYLIKAREQCSCTVRKQATENKR